MRNCDWCNSKLVQQYTGKYIAYLVAIPFLIFLILAIQLFLFYVYFGDESENAIGIFGGILLSGVFIILGIFLGVIISLIKSRS